MRRLSTTRKIHTCLLIFFAAAWLFQPSLVLAAKTLASKALAAAIEDGTFRDVANEMMMHVSQKQKFDFDEQGIEALGRRLLDQGENRIAIDVLQLNQVIHGQSPRAANALGDAYRDSGEDIPARIYYDMALNLDPENEHAKKATAEQGNAADLAMGAMGDMEMDPEAMQAALAQAGVEMTPEQQKKMQEAMAQMEAYQQDPSAYQPPKQEVPRNQTKKSSAAEPKYESEMCMVLHKYNAEKKISDPEIRARVEGHYQDPDHKNWTWNIETTCGEFLVAVPLWADVSPPVLKLKDGNRFEDYNGDLWDFEMGGDGKATSVTHTAADGTVTEMPRLGDPVSFE